MTEKELKRLNRYQLLELLIMQTDRSNALEAQLEEAREKLESKEIQMSKVGSIAEASVQLGGLLEAAQQTADIYLAAVEKRVAEIEAEAQNRANDILENARREAEQILGKARGKARRKKR